MAKTKSHSLSDVSDLLSSSWELFKQKWFELFILHIIGLAGYILLALVLGALVFIGFGGSLFSGHAFSSGVLPITVTLSVIGVIITILGFMAIASVIQIGSIKIVSQNKKHQYNDLIKASFPLVVPFVLTSLLMAFFSIGSAMILFIPALLLGLMMNFVGFEIVLNRKKYIEAIKRSVAIFENNFWPILGRLVLVSILGMILGNIPSLLDQSNNNPFISLLTIVIAFIFGWFQLCYTYIVYKQAESETPAAKKPHMLWIYIVTVVGWVLLVVFVVLLGQLIMSGSFMKTFKNIPKTPPHATYTLKKK